MSSVTETRIDRLWRDVGALEDRHSAGLSFEELSAAYADADGGPSVDGVVRFCKDICDADLTPQQVEGITALCESRQVLIQGGNGTGKDTTAGLWALYEAFVLGALVLITGPSERQVKEVCMRREIAKFFRRAKGKLVGDKYEMAIRIPGREAGGILAFTATDPEKFVGHHAPRVCIIATEAQGIGPDIFESMQRCQPTVLLAVCNPTSPDCAAYGFSRSPAWRTLIWSGLDHVNVTTGTTVIPGAVTRAWVDAMRLEHGEDSRFWTHAILAQWPQESEDALVQRSWLERSHALWHAGTLRRRGPLVLGVDPARLGPDATAVCVREGAHVREFVMWRGHDTMMSVDRVMVETRRLMGTVGSVSAVIIDSIGLGAGVLDRLKETMPRITDECIPLPWGADPVRHPPRVVGFDAASKPAGGKKGKDGKEKENSPAARFVNLRAQGYWHVRKLLEDGKLALPPNDELDEELLQTRVRFNADGKTQIEPKEDLRKRLGRSPDLADSLVISFAEQLDTGGYNLAFSPPGRARLWWNTVICMWTTYGFPL